MDNTYHQELRLTNRLQDTIALVVNILNQKSANNEKTAENLSSKILNILLTDLKEFNSVNFAERIDETNQLGRAEYLLSANNIYHRFIELIKLFDSSPVRMKCLSNRLALTCLTNFLLAVKCEQFNHMNEPHQVNAQHLFNLL